MGALFMLACSGTLVWSAVMVALDRQRKWALRAGKTAIAVLWTVTAVLLVLRYTKGIGAVSALSDQFPWGVWIGLDVMSGVALAAGGYVVAATVHIFHIKRFEPILRPTVLTAFLGYVLVAVTLLVDIGRPYRIWHPLIMWQHHSIMFEVAWCVTLYNTVLALEFSPAVLERLGLTRLLKWVQAITLPLVVLGVLLSTLHQSSLGSLFLIIPQKLSPLWYSPLLPVLFLISSVAAGLCMIIVESFFSARLFRRSLELPLLADLGRSAGIVVIFYLFARIADLVLRGAWVWVSPRTLQGWAFFIEVAGGFVLPAYLLAQKRFRSSPGKLVVCALLVVGGVVLNRLNTSWIGMLPYTGPVYLPSWMELAVTLSLTTGAMAVFALAVRFLPVFSPHSSDPA